MEWALVEQRFSELNKARDAGQPLAEPWAAFAEAARASEKGAPFHYQLLLSVLREARGGRPPGELVVLDHGCGGGFKSLYLLALGYREIYAVDVGGPCERWNPLLASELGIPESRFRIYDGTTLPIDENRIDCIISQQVLEHVSPDFFDSYYREEGRVLKPGGIAYHQVPHLLVPYDTHSRTWLIHCFPKWLRGPLYRLAGHDPDYFESILFYRLPWVHRAQVRRYIGSCEDRTVARIGGLLELDAYEGPKALRRAIGGAVRLPLLGTLIGVLLRNFVMLDTVSKKNIPAR